MIFQNHARVPVRFFASEPLERVNVRHYNLVIKFIETIARKKILLVTQSL
jgi:hypothetical protein